MLNNLILESQELQAEAVRIKRLEKKWEQTGLLEGLSPQKRGMVAKLMDNQAKLIKAQSLHETSMTSTTAGTEAWSNVALPLVRRVFANLIANELVSVQPMTLPSGLVFYLDFLYGNNKPNASAQSSSDPGLYATSKSVYGNTSGTASGSGMGGFYGGWNYSFTQNYITASNVSGNRPIVGGALQGTASWGDVEYEPSLSASIAAGALHILAFPSGAIAQFDPSCVKAITIDDAQIHKVYRAYSKVNATGGVELIVSGAESASFTGAQVDTVSYIRKTYQDWRGDFEYGQTQVGSIPEITPHISQKSVFAQTRKLKATWTPELQQDLQAYQNINAENELTAIMSELTGLEIDREIIADLMAIAVVKNYWSAKIGDERYPDGTVQASPGTFYGTKQEWYQTLVQKINEVSNEIHKRTLRGRANWIVTSPEIATILESTNSFRSEKVLTGTDNENNIGIEKFGTLSSRYKIFVDPYFPYNKMLIGFKGTSYLECGYAYCPYVPFILTPTVLNPDTFVPSRGLMTRYGKVSLKSEFFGVLTVLNLLR